MDELTTVTCKICGEPTAYAGTELCDGCWEVEHRLEYFLKNAKARILTQIIIDRFNVENKPDGVRALSEKIKHFRDAYTGGAKNAIIQMTENPEIKAAVVTCKILSAGEPNANGDIFPAGQVYEVGKPVFAPGGSDKPIGVIEKVDGDHITMRVRGDPPICPTVQQASMSARSGVVGKITKLKVDWDKFSVVQERNDHNVHIVAKRPLPGQPNANGDIFPSDQVTKTELDWDVHYAYLVDDAVLERLKQDDFDLRVSSKHQPIYLDGFYAETNEKVVDPLAAERGIPVQVLRSYPAQARRVGIRLNRDDIKDYDKFVSNLFDGSRHLVFLVHGNLFRWACLNLTIVDWKCRVEGRMLTLDSPCFEASGIFRHTNDTALSTLVEGGTKDIVCEDKDG